MVVISMVNIKGGVGKTVSTVNMAACFAEQHKRVLVIDLDAQSNATQYLKSYDGSGFSSYDVMMYKDIDIHRVIRKTEVENVDIVPANIKLATCESEIANNTMRSREQRLKRALSSVEGEYDYVIIDCPPSLGIFTTNALVASKYVLVPIKIDQFALDGLGYILETIDELKDEFNPGLEFMGAFITMDKRTAVNREVKEELRNCLGDKILRTSIRENVKVVQSTFEQQPVVIFDKNAISSTDYRALTREVKAHAKA